MHVSLILHAEHEFNASTFTARSIDGTGSDVYRMVIWPVSSLRVDRRNDRAGAGQSHR